MWRLRSLRWRLTLFYVGLMLILVLGLGIFVYFQLDGFLTDSSANRLSYEAAPKLTLGPALKKDNPDSSDNQANLQLLNTQVVTLITDTVYAATYNLQGQSVTSGAGAATPGVSSTSSSLPAFSGVVSPSLAQFELAKSTKNYHYVTDFNGRGRIVVIILPVLESQFEGPQPALPPDKLPKGSDPAANSLFSTPTPDSVQGFVVVAQPLMEADRILSQLRLILLLGAAGTIFLILLLGLPIARLGLAPLNKMTLTARRIAQGDLTQRVALKPLGGRKTFEKLDATGQQDEVRQLTVAFNQMLDQIEAAFSAQRQSEARTRQFVADASHELRTPLTTLGGSVDVLLMQSKDFPPQTLRFLKTMQREIDRLSRLVVNLLQLTRFDASGKQAVHLEPVRLDMLVVETCEDLMMLAGSRHLRFETKAKSPADATCYETAPLEEVWVQADNDRLRQVLTNLIDNAIRYTAIDGTITLRVQTTGSEITTDRDCNQWAKLEIEDNGAGIAPEHLDHIFDRFYRVDGSRVQTGSNSGLGLSIVKAIIEAHSGRITVTSQPGKGTIFTVWLPVLSVSSPHISLDSPVPGEIGEG